MSHWIIYSTHLFKAAEETVRRVARKCHPAVDLFGTVFVDESHLISPCLLNVCIKSIWLLQLCSYSWKQLLWYCVILCGNIKKNISYKYFFAVICWILWAFSWENIHFGLLTFLRKSCIDFKPGSAVTQEIAVEISYWLQVLHQNK